VTHQALQQVRETIHQHRVAYSLGKSKSVWVCSYSTYAGEAM
jgi:hypothetical protein